MAVAERLVQIAAQEILQPHYGDMYLMGGAMGDTEFEMFNGLNPEETIGLVTFAGSNEKRTFNAYNEIFRDYALRSDVISRKDSADQRGNREKIHYWKQLFLTGGNQQLIFEHLRDTELLEEIKKGLHSGLRLATTSAGTAALGGLAPYSYGGMDDDDPEIDARAQASAVCHLESSTTERTDLLLPGLNIFPRVIFDSHFTERDRMGRLFAGVIAFPKFVGVGVDENTGIQVSNGDVGRVFGTGKAHILKSYGGNVEVIPFSNGETFALSAFF